MQHLFVQGENISIELKTNEAPFRVHGTFKMQDDEFIVVEGTVGNDIGQNLVVPKSMIKLIRK